MPKYGYGNSGSHGGGEQELGTIIGTTGDDNLIGTSGNDIFNPKEGEDTMTDLVGGNDTYLIKSGYGQDVILDSSGNDTLQLLTGYNKMNIKVSQIDNDLVITPKDTTENLDSYTIKNWFLSDNYKIENFEFKTGNPAWRNMTSDQIEAMIGSGHGEDTEEAINITGTNRNDVLQGNNANNKITGEKGNDIIFGNDGNDNLNAGKGYDRLYGGNGDDTYSGYSLTRGLGRDIIVDQSGNDTLDLSSISSKKVSFKAIDSDDPGLKVDSLQVKFLNNSILINDYFDNSAKTAEASHAGSGCIENIELANVNLSFDHIQLII